MASAIVSLLPLGLGIALNPVAIVASILVARPPGGRSSGAAFAAGWILGLALLTALPALVVQGQAGDRRAAVAERYPLIWIGLGALLLVAAAWTLRRRSSSEGASGVLRRVGEGGGPLRAFGVGLFLATVSLRNLALLAAATGVVAQASLAIPELALTIAAFVAISSAGALLPLLARAVGGAGADAALERWGAWLLAHMGTITGSVMALLGVHLVARGLGSLF